MSYTASDLICMPSRCRLGQRLEELSSLESVRESSRIKHCVRMRQCSKWKKQDYHLPWVICCVEKKHWGFDVWNQVLGKEALGKREKRDKRLSKGPCLLVTLLDQTVILKRWKRYTEVGSKWFVQVLDKPFWRFCKLTEKKSIKWAYDTVKLYTLYSCLFQKKKKKESESEITCTVTIPWNIFLSEWPPETSTLHFPSVWIFFYRKLYFS